MKKITLDHLEYEVIENYKDGFDYSELEKKYIDYFYDYDYILGDWAYGKLRLKGFCNKNNSLYNHINDYNEIHNYIKNNCAYDCKYFILEKVTSK